MALSHAYGRHARNRANDSGMPISTPSAIAHEAKVHNSASSCSHHAGGSTGCRNRRAHAASNNGNINLHQQLPALVDALLHWVSISHYPKRLVVCASAANPLHATATWPQCAMCHSTKSRYDRGAAGATGIQRDPTGGSFPCCLISWCQPAWSL